MVRSGAAVASTTSSATTVGGDPSAGVSRSRARPRSDIDVPHPRGHHMSIVDVRRTEPRLRSGVAVPGPSTVATLVIVSSLPDAHPSVEHDRRSGHVIHVVADKGGDR